MSARLTNARSVITFVSDIAIFVLKGDVKLQLTVISTNVWLGHGPYFLYLLLSAV